MRLAAAALTAIALLALPAPASAATTWPDAVVHSLEGDQTDGSEWDGATANQRRAADLVRASYQRRGDTLHLRMTAMATARGVRTESLVQFVVGRTTYQLRSVRTGSGEVKRTRLDRLYRLRPVCPDRIGVSWNARSHVVAYRIPVDCLVAGERVYVELADLATRNKQGYIAADQISGTSAKIRRTTQRWGAAATSDPADDAEQLHLWDQATESQRRSTEIERVSVQRQDGMLAVTVRTGDSDVTVERDLEFHVRVGRRDYRAVTWWEPETYQTPTLLYRGDDTVCRDAPSGEWDLARDTITMRLPVRCLRRGEQARVSDVDLDSTLDNTWLAQDAAAGPLRARIRR